MTIEIDPASALVPGVRVRAETPADTDAIAQVVSEAFGEAREAELVRLLRASENFVPELSLVAEEEGALVGHTMLTYVGIEDGDRRHRVLSLSPLAVAPASQNRGIGGLLVRTAVRLADERGEPLVCLEGSPDYYARFGFIDARAHGIHFDLPDWAPRSAGQVVLLRSFEGDIKGRVVYPPAFAAVADSDTSS